MARSAIILGIIGAENADALPEKYVVTGRVLEQNLLTISNGYYLAIYFNLL